MSPSPIQRDVVGKIQSTSTANRYDPDFYFKDWILFYCVEWSYFKTDLEYLHFVLDRILTLYECKSYGDDTDGIGAALYQIKQTRDIPLPKYKDEENAYQFLRRLNATVLSTHKKIALKEKNQFSIYVCDTNKVGKLKSLASKAKVILVEP